MFLLQPRRLPLPTDTTDVASVNTPLVGTDLTDSGCGIDSRASSPVKSSFSLRVDEEHPRIRKIESKDGFALDDDNHPVSLQLFRNVRETVKVHLGPNGKLFHPLTVVGKMFDVYEVKQLKRPSVYRNRMVTLFLLATKLRKFEDKVARCQGLDDLLVVLRDGFYDLAIGVSRFATAFEPTLAMLESLQQAGVEPELEIDAVSFWKCAPGVLLEFFMALRPVSWVLQFQWKDSTRHGDSLESLHEELSYMIKDLGKLKLLSKLETGEFPVPVTWQRKVGTALGKAWAKVKAPFAGKSKVDVNEGKREPLLRRLLPRLPGRRQQDN